MPADPTASPASEPVSFESRFVARSYELDAFGHVNHAVFLNWLEQARFEALAAGGVSAGTLQARGWAVVVARVEVDFLKEVFMGDEVVVRTRVASARSSSMTLAQEVWRGEGDGAMLAAEASVVAVWISEGRPRRIPPDVREALGIARENEPE